MSQPQQHQKLYGDISLGERKKIEQNKKLQTIESQKKSKEDA